MSVPNDITSVTTTLAQFCLFPSPRRSPTTVHERRPLAAHTISTRTWHIYCSYIIPSFTPRHLPPRPPPSRRQLAAPHASASSRLH